MTQISAPIHGQVSVVGRNVTITVPTITRDDLINRLARTKGAKPVTIVTRTEPSMRKTGNPYVGQVYKISRVNGIINFHYEAAVNRQRTREGKDADFEALPRKWGTRRTGCCLVDHKDKVYVEMKVERSLGHEYQKLDGSPMDESLLKPFMSESSSSRQEVDKEIILRDYNIDNIVSITIDGETLLVR